MLNILHVSLLSDAAATTHNAHTSWRWTLSRLARELKLCVFLSTPIFFLIAFFCFHSFLLFFHHCSTRKHNEMRWKKQEKNDSQLHFNVVRSCWAKMQKCLRQMCHSRYDKWFFISIWFIKWTAKMNTIFFSSHMRAWKFSINLLISEQHTQASRWGKEIWSFLSNVVSFVVVLYQPSGTFNQL